MLKNIFKGKKKLSFYIILVIVLLVGITLGSALLSSTLKIIGNSTIKKNSWVIYFDDIDIAEDSAPVDSSNDNARISKNGVADPTKQNIEFTASLKDPGDFYEFTVWTVNDGTIDAEVESLEKSELTAEQQKYLDFDVTYDDGTPIEECDFLYHKGSDKGPNKRLIKAIVKYKDGINVSDYPANGVTLNLFFKINYSQNVKCNPDDDDDEDVKHKLTIRPNGGVYEGRKAQVRKYLLENEQYILSRPTRTLYNFDGWKVIDPETGGTFSIEPYEDKNKFTMGSEDVIIEAKWKEGDYVARIMDHYYTKVELAFDAVDGNNPSTGRPWENNTVWLIKDTEEVAVNNARNNFTFNLDGHTLTGKIINPSTGKLALVNGQIIGSTSVEETEKQRRIDEGKTPAPTVNGISGEAVLNYGILTLGKDDGTVEVDNSIGIIGSQYGIYNLANSKFKFYDGYIQSRDAFSGLTVNYTTGDMVVADNHFTFIDHRQENGKDYQKVYLTPSPNRAVVKTTTVIPAYYYNLQDALDTVVDTKNKNRSLTDNDYIIEAIRTFEAAYDLEVQLRNSDGEPIETNPDNTRVFFDLKGFSVQTGKPIINNGYLKVYNSKQNNSTLQVSKSIVNNSSLEMDNIRVISSTSDDSIINKNKLKLTKVVVNSHDGYAVKNIENGTLDFDKDVVLRSLNQENAERADQYALYNSGTNATLNNGTIYGLYNTGKITISGEETQYIPVWNYTNNNGTKVYLRAIYNSGNIIMDDGIITTNLNTPLITNIGTFTFNDGTITSEYLAVDNSGTFNVKGSEVVSSRTAINGGTVNVDGGNVRTSTTEAITSATINVKNGEVIAEDGIAVGNHSALNIQGGTVTGTTYGINGNYSSLNISSGIITAPIAANVSSATVSGGKVIGSEYAIISSDTNISGGEITSPKNSVVTTNLTMTGGKVDCENEIGITINGTGNITGGEVYGGTYGVLSKDTLTLGSDDGEISSESPMLEGELLGLYIEGSTTNFYDGILKGQNDGYQGNITGTPLGGVVGEGVEDRGEDGIYNTDFISNFAGWLRIGDTPYNTLNAASSSVGENEEATIIVTRDADVTFVQKVIDENHNKKITLDLNGHKVTTTQRIINNSNFTIIDSAPGTYDDTGTGPGTLKIIKNDGIINEYKLNINSGRFESITDYLIINKTNEIDDNTNEVIRGTEINGGTFNVVNTLVQNGVYEDNRNKDGYLRINGINVETSKNTFINSYGLIEINGTKNKNTNEHTTVINATNNIVNNETTVIINGGKLTAENSIVTGNYGNVIVNETKNINLTDENQVASTDIKSTVSHALYSYWGTITVNSGNVTTANNTAIVGHHPININGGTITGTRGIKNEQWCTWLYCGYEPVTVKGGTIIGTQYEGIYLTAPRGYNSYIYGGKIIGQTDGIYNNSTTFLGYHEGELSITNPEIRGINGYGFNNNGYMYFYDGILKGKKKDGISNSSHNGMIQVVEDATQVKRDYEYINNVYYETEYLETQGDWLEIEGKGTFNTVDKACNAAVSGDTIKVIADTHIAFAERCASGKTLTFDENGHSVTFTQPITFESDMTFIDSVGNGLLHDKNHNMIITTGTSQVKSGNYSASGENESIAFVNHGTTTITGGTFTSINSQAISNIGTMTYNIDSEQSAVSSDNTYGISNGGTLNFKNGIVKTYGGIDNTGTFTMDNGYIEGEEIHSLNAHGGMSTINGGELVNKKVVAANMYCSGDITVNGGKIKSTITNSIYASGGGYGCDSSEVYVNGGEVIGKTNGIVNGSSAVYFEVNGGHIVGQENNGININSCNTQLNGGIIEGGVYGVYTKQASGYTTQLGSNDGDIAIDAPVLKGELFGLYIDSGTLNFYDGILKGQNEGFSGQITNIADRTELYYEDDEIINEVEFQVVYLLAEKVIARNIDKPSGDLSYTEYTNLQDAFSTASNGDTIELVDNAPIYYPVTNNKNITFDMKGYSISTNKMIVNNGELVIKNTNSSRQSEIKTSASINLLSSTNNIKLDNILLRNSSSSEYVLTTTGETELNNVRVSSIYGINSTNKLIITDSNISTSNTAINNTGLLSITGGSYSGNRYSIYSSTNSNVNIKNVTLSGVYYNSGSNVARLENSIVNGELQNRTSNITILESTLNRDVSNTGTMLIDTSHVRDSISNSGTMTLQSSDVIGLVGDVIQNSGTMTIKDSSTNLTGLYYYYYTTYTGITNTGILNINNSLIEQDRNQTHSSETHAIHNTGTLNISNKSKVVVGTDTNQSSRLIAIYSAGNGFAEIINSNILVKNAGTGYGIYLDSDNSKVIFKTDRIYPEETELAAIQQELDSLTDEEHGLSETNEEITSKVKVGKIEVMDSNTSYGAYINRGTFEMGAEDGSGDASANVSIFKPLVKAIGSTRGIAIKKIDGLFNFYDGRVVGSRYAKPETTSKVERNYEVTTYVDSDTGYEYAYLEYMKEDYQYSNAIASITRALSTTYYPSVAKAIEAANPGEEIVLLQSVQEDVLTIDQEDIINLNLNGRSITTKIINSGTLQVYNGSIQNFDEPAIVNNGTLVMGQDDGKVSATNIRVISEVNAIRQNGTLTMYDGYIEGNPTVQGEINSIAPFSRIYTVKDTQSEKKYLQSLDEQSIRDGDTALFITIDPISGYYDGVKGSQIINKFYSEVLKIKEPTKGGCTFLGWDVSGDVTLVPIEEGTEDYNNGYRYQFTVGLTDVTLTARWEVSERAVAKIGEEYFESVSDAIMAAKENDKIEIIKDVTEDVSNNKNVTIDLGTHTITGTFINTGILRIVNGTIYNPEGIGIWNKKTLIVGENDGNVSMDSVKIIGTTIGIQQDGGLKFYDGYIEAEVALNGDVDQVPQGYFLYIEHNDETNCQREYLIGNPENAVAIIKKGSGEEGTVQYFFGLQDAIDSAAVSGKEIFIIKKFTATYPITIKEGKSATINLNGFNIQLGNEFTNNGTLLIHDTTEADTDNPEATKGTIATVRTLTNNGTMTVDDVTISQSKDIDTISNTEGATLNINNATISALSAYAINSQGTLNLNGDYSLTSNSYALFNQGNNLIINSGLINGIISTKDLTIEQGANISVTANNVAAIIPRTKLTVNGGTISSSGNNAIYTDISGTTVTINSGTITGTNGLYCASATDYVINGGTITTTGTGAYMRASNCNFEINDGTITAGSYGLNVESSYHNINIKGGEIKSTGTYGVRMYQYNNDGCTYNQTGGKIIGATHGLQSYDSNITITGGEITTTSTNSGHYALYSDYNPSITIGGDAFINAPNASAIRSWTPLVIKDNAHIYSGAPNGYGIEFGSDNSLTISDNAKIETTGSSSVALHLMDGNYTQNITMNGGQIISNNIGIHTSTYSSTKTININSGSIIGDTYGIYHVSPGTTINIGNKNDDLSITSPFISGGTYAMYKTTGGSNFYSGRLRGYTNGYNDDFNVLRKGKDVTRVEESIEGTDKYLTYSTENISSNPISTYAKIGHGHAKITYIGEDNGTCLNGSSTDFPYTGEEEEYNVTCTGKYKLEVWGASGGGYDANDAVYGSRAGAGAYSVGEITLTSGEKLYINVGGQGAYGSGTNVYGGPKGGYNGGGDGGNSISGAGGGATHIATASGLLSTLENNKSSVIIVAGGGGGADDKDGSGIRAGNDGTAGSAGGEKGSPGQVSGIPVNRGNYNASSNIDGGCGAGGTQDTGYAFGRGESVNCSTDTGGAGGGWYGGYVTNHNNGGAGGGSGYIGNTRLSNASMYGYNVEPTKSKWVINYLIDKDNYLQVDDEQFNSINDAVKYIVDNKNGSGTILLIKNASSNEDATIDADTNIIFNLQNNTLSSTKHIINKGTLKVINGNITNTKDDVIQNENSLTVEDAVFTVASGYTGIYIPTGVSNGATTSVKDSTITGGAYGILSNSKNDVIVENSDITSSDVSIYFTNTSSNSSLDFESGTITSTEASGIRIQDNDNVTVNITSGTINAKTYGIYGHCSRANITIDTMNITSTNNEAIRFDTYNSNYNTLDIKAGTYKGADYGIVAQSTHLTMTGGTVETSSTRNDRYAIYGYYYTNIDLDNVTVNAPTASGIYLNTPATINNTNITAGHENAYGIITYNETFSIGGTTKIVTTGINSKGIQMESGKLTMNNGTIESSNIGVLLNNGSVFNMIDGSILARTYGIEQDGSTSTLTIGTTEQELSNTRPVIKGRKYGINRTAGVAYFYNGLLGGGTYGFNTEFNSIRQKMKIVEEVSFDELVTKYTLSTENVSELPVSKYAKKGDGHVRITYLGETNDTCENGKVYDIGYTGDETIFETECSGEYKLELWGASGKYTSETRRGGYGGYSTGTISLTSGEKLYINVGGAGTTSSTDSSSGIGGYNGGGSGGSSGGAGGGGGATHIATQSGLLSTLENNKDSVIIVAGGGGGYAVYGCSTSIGGSGGGHYGAPLEYGGTQTSGGPTSGQAAGSFGKGGYQSNTYHSTPGAGAGWYGGGTGTSYCGGGGGSGYIGNVRLSNAYMYGYEVEATANLWVYNYLADKDVFLQVDDEKFNSMNDAVKYIVDNKDGVGTILLLNDATMQEDTIITENTDIVLDLQEHTLTTTTPIINKAKFKIINGSLENPKDNVINNHGDLTLDTVEMTVASTSTGVYTPTDISGCKLNIKDSSISGGTYAIYIGSKEDIVINNTELSSSSTTLYINASESTLELDESTITSTDEIGIRFQGSNSTTAHLSNSEINAKSHGIYGYCQLSNITLDNMKVTSINHDAIGMDTYNANSNNLTITGGTYKGGEYGIVAQSTNLSMIGGTVENTSTRNDRYAVYGYYHSSIYLENVTVNAPSSSGIYCYTNTVISNSTINANHTSAYGINAYSSDITITDGTKINTSGSSSRGIYAPYSTIKILDADIDSANVGIYMDNSSTVKIDNGKIFGTLYGIQEVSGNNNLTIGNEGDDVSIYNPYIEGGTYGIYKTNGTTNFYSGRLKGLTGPYYGVFNNIKDGYEVHEEADGVELELQSVRTMSTDSVSQNPTINSAKAGNGYAKITYNRLDYVKSKYSYSDEYNINKNKYDFPYIGDVQTFKAPITGDYKIELWGAQGGDYQNNTEGGNGHHGGYTSGIIHLEEGTKLYVYVGQGLSCRNCASFNATRTSTGSGNPGGGATDIRLVPGQWDSLVGLRSRIMVAGGGGSSEGGNWGGEAGGLVGYLSTRNSYINTGGSQVGPGVGQENPSGCATGGFGYGSSCGATGGGGYYGGGGASHIYGSGSGGSSFISGHLGAVAVTSSSDTTPRKDSNNVKCTAESAKTDITCSYHYSGYKFTNTVMIDGLGYEWNTDVTTNRVGNPTVTNSSATEYGHTGNGYARITVLNNENSKYKVHFINEQGTSFDKVYNANENLGTLTDATTNRTDIDFEGWYLEPTYENKVTSSYTVTKSINLYAKYVYNTSAVSGLVPTRYTTDDILTTPVYNVISDYSYTGNEQVYTVPRTGLYKLETWGASGGSFKVDEKGGFGGYSTGNVLLHEGDTLYINVGGEGVSQSESFNMYTTLGGYNGGGNGGKGSYGYPEQSGGSGGGATHIATKSGILSSFDTNENNKADSDEIDELLIVAGGGGGASYAAGGAGGGASGNSSVKIGISNNEYPVSVGATQDDGYAFGLGQSGRDSDNSYWAAGGTGGGGGGFYGGYTYQSVGSYTSGGGSGGSGYIGNTSLTSKKMYCYQCTESTDTNSKTISTTNQSSDAISEYAKSGDGHARITYLSDSATVTIEFMHDYGTLTSETINYTSGDVIGSLPTPSYDESVMTFKGWYYEPTYQTQVKSTDSIINNTRVFAKYVYANTDCDYSDGQVFTFDYIGHEEVFMATCPGEYKLETWGAQGANYSVINYGGYGSYSVGNVELGKNEKLYINVGGQGQEFVGGYNGGGNAASNNGQTAYAGGGATHIATKSGLLSTLENNRDKILIVSGGGGGAGYAPEGTVGGSAGGYQGNSGFDGHNRSYTAYNGTGATQDSPGYAYSCGTNYSGSFGKGGDYCNSGYGGAGGGGGYYGGGGSNRGHGSGGGGSGYIGNPRLYDKFMYGYNVSTKNAGLHSTVAYLLLTSDFVKNTNKPEGENTYKNLQTALDAASDGDTLELLSDASISYDLVIDDLDVTLDLKGFNLSTTKKITNNSTLHIINTDTTKISKISNVLSSQFITNETNASISFDKVTVEGNNTIINKSSGTLSISNSTIKGTEIGINNSGIINILNSNIEGNTYSIYDNSSSTNSIVTNTQLSSSSTAFYTNGAGKIKFTDSNFTGVININNSTSTVNIEKENNSSTNINGYIYNKGNLTIKDANITITSGDYRTINLVENNGLLTISDSKIELTDVTSSGSGYETRAIYSSGTLTSSRNRYVLKCTDNTKSKYFFGIYNVGILNTTSDAIEGSNGVNFHGIYNNSVHDSTITNISIKAHDIRDYAYGIYLNSSVNTLNGINIELYDSNNTTGIYVNDTAVVNIENIDSNLHDNTSGTGIYVNNGSITLISGSISVNGGTSYGVKMASGTYTQGTYDGRGTESSDVSTTDPDISSIGTTKGIGVSMGNGTFKYYDGHISTSTSVLDVGDIESETEYRYHIEYSQDNKSCVLKFNM